MLLSAEKVASFGMSDFKKLEVWRKAHALALNVHRAAIGIRGANYSGLRSQMIRSSMSIPTNIVEGNGQRTKLEFGRFVRIAVNSSQELEYHLIVARDVQLISASDYTALSTQTIEVRKMMHGLLRHLNAGPAKISA